MFNWDILKQRHALLTQKLADFQLDRNDREKFQREFNHLSTILAKRTEVERFQQELAGIATQMQENKDPDMVPLFEEERQQLSEKFAQSERELDALLAPSDVRDNRSVYLEIRAGAGGKEAALFAGDLLKMYTNYALKKGWRVEMVSVSDTDLGGFKEVIAHIKGENVYGYLKRESGVHRVQRVPETEASGRVHTSTATVAVLPEAEDVDITIDPQDLRIDVFRASGAGGQHVNTTDSAVRITHIPTGVVVSCQDERSQIKNKAKALKVLQARLLAAQEEKKLQEMSSARKQQVGTGMRAEKVRTYNYPQNRVTDHQVDITLKKLDRVMEGDLDDIIDELRKEELEARKKDFLAQFS